MPKRLPLIGFGLMLLLNAFNASAQAVHQQGQQNQAHQAILIDLPTTQALPSLPYYALRIPLALYAQSANSQLSDLKLRNAKGEYVNYAWLDGATETMKMESHTLPFFPLFSTTDDQPEGKDKSKDKGKNRDQENISLQILRRADGSLALPNLPNKINATPDPNGAAQAWIVDASKLSPNARLVQVRIRIDKNFQGIVPLKIEGSNDFKHWFNVGDLEQLVQLQHQGEQIQKLSINLGHSTAKYLRFNMRNLSPSTSQSAQPLANEQTQAVLRILEVSVDIQESELIAPQMEWTKAIQAYQCDAQSCDYHVPANLPLDSLRLHLQEKNTLAKVQLFGELPIASVPDHMHHRYRNPLHVLRHQKQIAKSASTQEIFLGDTTAYRLALPSGEISTEDMPLSGSALTKIRVQISAGVKSLGAVAPTISLGSFSRSLVFLARGDAPYRVEFSNNKKEGIALNVNTLMPQQILREQALTFAEIKIPSTLIDLTAAPATKANSNTIAAPSSTENLKTKTQKSYWLWAALVAAIAIIGAMIWSLLGNIDKTNTDEKKMEG